MQTRSEALLEAIRQVDSNITDTNERMSEAVRILEDSGNEHAAAIRESADLYSRGIIRAADTVKEAAEIHGKSIERATNTLVGGLIVTAVIGLFGAAVYACAQTARKNNQIIEMFISIWSLQQKYGALKYGFVLNRAYAGGTTREERREILNLLIREEIVQDNYQNNPDLLFIDDDSDPVIAFREFVWGPPELEG